MMMIEEYKQLMLLVQFLEFLQIMAGKTLSVDTIEPEVQRLARALYQKAAEHKPSLFEAKDLLGRMIDWSLEDESLRVALFRFVDVLPSLESSTEIGRHLEEYFARVDHALGGLAILAQALHAGTLVAPVVRRNVIKLARRFIAEESGDSFDQGADESAQRAGGLHSGRRRRGDGERRGSGGDAAALSRSVAPAGEVERRLAGLRADRRIAPTGKIPRVNLSVKLSSLCARFDPLDPNTGVDRARAAALNCFAKRPGSTRR